MKRVRLSMKFLKLVKVEIPRFNTGKKMTPFTHLDSSTELRLTTIGDACRCQVILKGDCSC